MIERESPDLLQIADAWGAEEVQVLGEFQLVQEVYEAVQGIAKREIATIHEKLHMVEGRSKRGIVRMIGESSDWTGVNESVPANENIPLKPWNLSKLCGYVATIRNFTLRLGNSAVPF